MCKVSQGQESLWFEDLKKLTGKFQRNRHEIILHGDFNNNLNNENGQVNSFMQDNELREVLIQRYGKSPTTHINGSITIDGVSPQRESRYAKKMY